MGEGEKLGNSCKRVTLLLTKKLDLRFPDSLCVRMCVCVAETSDKSVVKMEAEEEWRHGPTKETVKTLNVYRGEK